MATSDFHRRAGSSMRRQYALPREVDPSALPSVTTSLLRGRAESSRNTHDLTPTVKALTALVILLGVAALGVAAWRIGSWRRKKLRSRTNQRMSQYVSDKPNDAFHISFQTTAGGEEKKSFFGAFPSLLSRPAPVHSESRDANKDTNRFIGGLHIFPKKVGGQPKTPATSHSATRGFILPRANRAPVPETPSVTVTRPDSTGSASVKSLRTGRTGRITDLRVDVDAKPRSMPPGHALALQLLTANSAKPAQAQIPSPRSTSFGIDTPFNMTAPLSSRPKSAGTRSANGKRLPRLMIVTCTFVPSLADELLIKVGETLRLIEEYEDEWCMVQKVGKNDTQKGVIPRFCLQERPDIMPRPSLKKVMAAFGPMTPAPPSARK